MSAAEYYAPSGTPGTASSGSSAAMRAEMTLIQAGFAKLPDLATNANKAVIINGGANGMTVTVGTLALAAAFALVGAFATTLNVTAPTSITLPTTGTLATLAGVESLSNKTFVGPALGTPVSGVLTNCTGTASGLTAGAATLAATVTTNANLTGPITSSGNATSVAAQTGTGSTFVMSVAPTLTQLTLSAAASKIVPGATSLSLRNNADSADNLIVTDAGAVTIRSSLTVGGASMPQNSQSTAYTTVAADANKHILHPVADTNNRTFTIDSNANVAYAIGTCITFVNEVNTLTIAITSDTMTLAGTATTGSRSLVAGGIATALKIASTKWIISGVGLS